MDEEYFKFVSIYGIKSSSLTSYPNTPGYVKFREFKKVIYIEDMPLVMRKGVCPYEYTDSWENLEEA
ncbi:Ribonuclease H-like domain [Cinara cedri]|uniref:Ribonuclease H-like domain n=1 Tax=Cinara cedri TaxID=506608 RepID=A0A5E4N7R7_9HEMI|nr:Ribonuclease H-like domain [Cinara cedri]